MGLSFTRDADILAMFADSPHTITAGDVTAAPCLFDEFDQAIGEDGGVLNRVPRATVQTSVFPAIKNGDDVSISDGAETETFTVWSHRRFDDGALTELFLRAEVDDEESA